MQIMLLEVHCGQYSKSSFIIRCPNTQIVTRETKKNQSLIFLKTSQSPTPPTSSFEFSKKNGHKNDGKLFLLQTPVPRNYADALPIPPQTDWFRAKNQ